MLKPIIIVGSETTIIAGLLLSIDKFVHINSSMPQAGFDPPIAG